MNVRATIAMLVVSASASVSACSPEPKFAPCRNDAECRQHDDGYEHCVQSRCVECVSGAAMCPARQSCVGGRCVER